MARAKNDAVNTQEENMNDAQIPQETPQEEYTPLNLDQQVTVRSIAGWNTGFVRGTTVGDVQIPPRGSVRLTRNEIIYQGLSGNKLFMGFGDNPGDHATLIIEDERTKAELGIINPKVFSEKIVKDLFDIRGYEEFSNALQEKIQTRAEKYAAMVAIVKLGLNDYSKIRAFEEHTGFKLDKVKNDELHIH